MKKRKERKSRNYWRMNEYIIYTILLHIIKQFCIKLIVGTLIGNGHAAPRSPPAIETGNPPSGGGAEERGPPRIPLGCRVMKLKF